MKLGGTPLVEYTRDRLHRETVRSFGSRAGSNAAYELTSTYTPAGQLQSQHLNSLVYDRDYGWNDNGDLVRISGPRQTREYGYSATGRLESVRTLAPDLDIRIPYATDPAGNRLPDPELHPDSTLTAWPDNRIAEDAHYVYHYDEYGRLTEKTDRIPTGVIRTDDERTHHYHYDSQHRLVFHTRIQHGEPLVESRYLYDPLGRRMAKRVWRRERDLTGWMSLSRKPEETWYGWDGDRLTTVQTDTTRIQTVYEPGSFTPLIRVETENGEREKAQRRSLAEKLQQEGSEDGHGVVFPAELVRLLDRLEEEIRADRVSSESRVWLAQCGLTVEQLARQVEPEYTPARKVHFYHCDHRGQPLALISEDGDTVWSGEYDEWGNQLNEENPHHVYQPYRLPGQQYDEESGLYYNRHRYYDPLQRRYITQDPIGLKGGWNLYQYPLNPVSRIDPLGLFSCESCSHFIDDINNKLDNLPFNPTKMFTASLNTANSARLYASGMTKFGISVAADGTIIAAPVGAASMALGAWNIKSATAAYNRANLQLSESLQENGRDRCWRNLLGILPYGEQFDDPGEPSILDVYGEKIENIKDSPMKFFEELGTLGL
ncbi:TPA: RHS repeat protein [Escherichia coli]|nr:RHS repeat protein [Escherichia coli]HAX4546616.1 RHS repeat protein [Escherichia coli]HAY5018342.1 RHS repeat protein [Escherichia coli]HAY5099520.1 RHS repeat protein [Escherichia coli]